MQKKEETKAEVAEKKNDAGEKKSGGGDAVAAGGKKDAGPTVIVLKLDLHCEGCAKKVKRSIRHLEGNYYSSLSESSLSRLYRNSKN